MKNHKNIAWRDDEIRRYAGIKESNYELEKLIGECKSEAEGMLKYALCYDEFPLSMDGDEVNLSFSKVISKDLAENLKGASRAIVFACSIGVELDRLVAKYGNISPTKGLIMHAIGVERVEGLADCFNTELKDRYRLKPRFSPGYGDLGLSIQRDIIDVLGATKNIGITLNDNFTLSPSKSITAIIGVGGDETCGIIGGCVTCNRKECQFRR